MPFAAAASASSWPNDGCDARAAQPLLLLLLAASAFVPTFQRLPTHALVRSQAWGVGEVAAAAAAGHSVATAKVVEVGAYHACHTVAAAERTAGGTAGRAAGVVHLLAAVGDHDRLVALRENGRCTAHDADYTACIAAAAVCDVSVQQKTVGGQAATVAATVTAQAHSILWPGVQPRRAALLVDCLQGSKALICSG